MGWPVVSSPYFYWISAGRRRHDYRYTSLLTAWANTISKAGKELQKHKFVRRVMAVGTLCGICLTKYRAKRLAVNENFINHIQPRRINNNMEIMDLGLPKKES